MIFFNTIFSNTHEKPFYFEKVPNLPLNLSSVNHFSFLVTFQQKVFSIPIHAFQDALQFEPVSQVRSTDDAPQIKLFVVLEHNGKIKKSSINK